jgi:hypothetical protein
MVSGVKINKRQKIRHHSDSWSVAKFRIAAMNAALLEGLHPADSLHEYSLSNPFEEWSRFKRKVQWIINGLLKPTNKSRRYRNLDVQKW